MIYFTADTHFGHKNIIRLCARPFSSADEMDETIIENWNLTVKPKDEVYILGDLTMRSAEDAHKYLTRLNGRKYLVRGNHDWFLKDFAPFESDFAWIKDYHTFKADKQRYVLFHYPILEWENYHRGSVHLFGHIHNRQTSVKLPVGSKVFNVGVDVNDYRPVSIQEILEKIKTENQSE